MQSVCLLMNVERIPEVSPGFNFRLENCKETVIQAFKTRVADKGRKVSKNTVTLHEAGRKILAFLDKRGIK